MTRHRRYDGQSGSLRTISKEVACEEAAVEAAGYKRLCLSISAMLVVLHCTVSIFCWVLCLLLISAIDSSMFLCGSRK